MFSTTQRGDGQRLCLWMRAGQSMNLSQAKQTLVGCHYGQPESVFPKLDSHVYSRSNTRMFLGLF